MLAYVQMYDWRDKADINDGKGTALCAGTRMQRSEQTFTLFYNKSTRSVVDEANFQNRRTHKDLLSLWKHPKAERQAPSEVEANEFELQLMLKF